MKNNLKLNQFSALKLQGFLCVLAGVLRSSYTRFDVFCNSQKTFEQEKNLRFKKGNFQRKKILSSARQATYNQLSLEELKTMKPYLIEFFFTSLFAYVLIMVITRCN